MKYFFTKIGLSHNNFLAVPTLSVSRLETACNVLGASSCVTFICSDTSFWAFWVSVIRVIFSETLVPLS